MCDENDEYYDNTDDKDDKDNDVAVHDDDMN